MTVASDSCERTTSKERVGEGCQPGSHRAQQVGKLGMDQTFFAFVLLSIPIHSKWENGWESVSLVNKGLPMEVSLFHLILSMGWAGYGLSCP